MTDTNPYPDGAAQVDQKELGIDREALWAAADKLRSSIDAAEYKHVVLGLIFLKYISDAFVTRRTALREELEADGLSGQSLKQLLESRDEYTAVNVFWVPPEARWAEIQAKGKIATVSAGHIGKGEMVNLAPVTASRHIGRSAWNVMAFATEKSFCDKEMASIRTPASSHEVRKSENWLQRKRLYIRAATNSNNFSVPV